MYYRDKSKSLTAIRGKLRSFGEIEKILGKGGLRDLGLEIPPRQDVALNKAEEEMSSTSEVAKADDIELQEITKNVAENLIEQLEGESPELLPNA